MNFLDGQFLFEPPIRTGGPAQFCILQGFALHSVVPFFLYFIINFFFYIFMNLQILCFEKKIVISHSFIAISIIDF